MKDVSLGNFNVGLNSSPFIVAEAGINHNGEIEKAFEMIKIAKNVGATAIKFQTFKASEFIIDEKQEYSYISQGKKITESMLDMFQRCEFSRNEWFEIKNMCQKIGILFLSTPQNVSDLELLLELDVPAIKVGSDDFTNIPLIKNYSKTNLPLIISCGMANLSEIYETLDALNSFSGYPTILLLTTSQYPTPLKDVNLRKLITLSKCFPNIPLGFSDHTQGTLAATMAVALNACFFEKHFTLDNNLPGPDHWFSENPKNLKNWVDSIKNAHEVMGNPELKATKEEEKMKTLVRRSIVSISSILKGDKLDITNIGLRRPGNGLSASFFEVVINKHATKNISKGSQIQIGDFE